ncbi:MAG: thiolase domain-containing protein [Kiritimatiellota bacterium]|nr:thiolase domain-containing protein [Kiritimatiellota bacterium]
MSEVFIAGIGMTPVGEQWDLSLANLSARAILAAIKDSGNIRPQALYVGNFLAYTMSSQANLGTLLVDNAGLGHIETFTAEAGEASGAAALHMGYLAVKSDYINAALVVGIEKYTDMVGAEVEGLISQSTDYDFEATEGLTPAGQAGMLMSRYIDTCQAPREAFATLPLLAHANAIHNPNAMYRKVLSLEAYNRAPVMAYPLNLFDAAPYADGAAAVLLVNEDLANSRNWVRVAASSVVVDALALHDRPDSLAFSAVTLSIQKALAQAGLDWDAINLFELWDAFSIYGILTIEACGLAARGEGWRWLQENDLSPKGHLPLLTMGGNKARGFPLAAAGVYQVAEAVLQLRGVAGANQVQRAKTALTQAMGGPASTVITHVLKK